MDKEGVPEREGRVDQKVEGKFVCPVCGGEMTQHGKGLPVCPYHAIVRHLAEFLHDYLPRMNEDITI